jgi:hypothetical protein
MGLFRTTQFFGQLPVFVLPISDAISLRQEFYTDNLYFQMRSLAQAQRKLGLSRTAGVGAWCSE